VRARDPETGNILWETSLTDPDVDGAARRVSSLSVAVDDDEVAAIDEASGATHAPRLSLLDVRTGKLRSTRTLDLPDKSTVDIKLVSGELFASATTAGDFGGSPVATLERLDRTTGARLWKTENVGASIALDTEALVVRGPGAVLRALDVTNGAVVWSFGAGSLRYPAYPGPDVVRVAPDEAHRGQLLVAAPAGIWTYGSELTLFARGPTVVAPRTVDIEVRQVEKGVVVPDPDRDYEINGAREKSTADGGVKSQVTGRGVVLVSPIIQGAGDGVAATAFDLETGKPKYRIDVPYDSTFVQGCH
jgi:outer membrane protein assembly factor BamB